MANGGRGAESPWPSTSQQAEPRQPVVRNERWLRAEETIQKIIWKVQPTVLSETRRKAIINYLSKLIKKSTGAEVLPFGSVPLRSYLPDGDIDLSAFLGGATSEALATEIRAVLGVEEQNKDAVFEVKDIQYINAEVKLVKCVVQNVVIDISFNQIGGLYTLWFLEQADAVIGQDHLFKRSIILIKSWCYYESHILGAHHGLLSTYALESLILYIIRIFCPSDGPLKVLYRFLAYFGEFDWNSFCISLHGPIHLSSLPTLEDSSRGSSSSNQMFRKKYLNIVDPLNQYNNLGRSVSEGNSYRIRKALKYGAQELESILMLPPGEIDIKLKMFFMKTLDRHDTGKRADLQNAFPHDEDIELLRGKSSGSREGDLASSPLTSGHYGALAKEIKKINLSATKKEHETKIILNRSLTSDTTDLTTNKMLVSREASETYKVSPPNTYASHFVFQPDSRFGNHILPARISVMDSSDSQKNISSRGTTACSLNTHGISDSATLSSSQNPNCGKDSELGRSSIGNEGGAANSSNKPVNLLDLDGNVELHHINFLCAQQCVESNIGTHYLSSPAQLDHEELWNALQQQNKSLHTNAFGVIHEKFPPPCLQQSDQLHIAGQHGVEVPQRQRGTGTYISIMNSRHDGRRAFPGYYNNNQAAAAPEEYLATLESQEAPLHRQHIVCGLNDQRRLDTHQSWKKKSRKGKR